MSAEIDWIALAVLVFFFALVTVMGFFAARWKAGPVDSHLDEWGLAYAAHIKVASNNDVVPMLFKTLFPPWFAGFAFSAIAIGELVPAAVMSIGASNLFTRNVWKSYVNPGISHAGEASVAKIASLVVKVGALAFTIFLPTQYALDLQLLGGLWILQTFPALVFSLFTRWFRAEGLLLGWAAGILWGSWTAWSNGLKPLATLDIGGASYVFYVGLGALILNVALAAIVTVIVNLVSPRGVTVQS